MCGKCIDTGIIDIILSNIIVRRCTTRCRPETEPTRPTLSNSSKNSATTTKTKGTPSTELTGPCWSPATPPKTSSQSDTRSIRSTQNPKPKCSAKRKAQSPQSPSAKISAKDTSDTSTWPATTILTTVRSIPKSSGNKAAQNSSN